MLALAGLIGFVGRPHLLLDHWNPARTARAEMLARDGKFVSKKRGIVRSHLARPSAEKEKLEAGRAELAKGTLQRELANEIHEVPELGLVSRHASLPDPAVLYFSSQYPTSNLYVHGEPRGSVGKRMYIYRSGATDNCALTATKNDPRLPPAPVPDNWQFWMQIGPLQAQGGRCGFDVRAAVDGITTKGYYLFKGSSALLHERQSAISKQEGRSNA
jgi:hypothetical protein